MTHSKLINYLKTHVENSPKALFLTKIESNTAYSYEKLYEATLNYCHHLATRNLDRGDRILYFSDNDWFVFPLLLSCSLLDLTLVPVSPHLHRDDIDRIVKDVQPKLVIGSKGNLSKYFINVPQLDILDLEKVSEVKKKIEKNETSTIPLLIIYTSGSSGQCKGVMITESNIISAAESIVEYYKISHVDKFLCILPLYHMNAIMVTGMVPLLTGASILLSDVFDFTNAMAYFKRVELYKPTILSLIPSIMAILIKIENKEIDLSSKGVRFAFCGAAPLSSDLWKQFERKFNVSVYQGYGLTETTFWATLSPTDASKDYQSVGKPHNCQIKIESKEKGKAGEILISGPFVTKGYFNNPEGFGFDAEGYFRTGDLGYIGENKQLYILGRLKDIIIKNGVNIYPQSIDDILLQHPNIEDCASIGVEHDITGEQVYTVCVPSSHETITELGVKVYAKERLSSYMIPDRILFASSLPRGATGKLIKRKLLDLIQTLRVEKSRDIEGSHFLPSTEEQVKGNLPS